MKTLHRIMVAGTLAIFACAAPGAASAQDRDDRDQDRRQTQSSRERSSAQERAHQARQRREEDQRKQKSKAKRGDMQKDEISGEGTIRRTKKVGVRGQSAENMVILFRAPDSDTDRVADLGPVTNLKETPIRSGENLRMVGRVVQVGDKQVLMVRKFYTEEEPDKAIVIVRNTKDQKSSQQRNQGQRTARDDDDRDDRQNQSRQNRENSSQNRR